MEHFVKGSSIWNHQGVDFFKKLKFSKIFVFSVISSTICAFLSHQVPQCSQIISAVIFSNQIGPGGYKSVKKKEVIAKLARAAAFDRTWCSSRTYCSRRYKISLFCWWNHYPNIFVRMALMIFDIYLCCQLKLIDWDRFP